MMAGKIWPGTRALAMGHLAQGQEVWLVTATPVEVARVIARRLGLTGALGTVAEIVDGVYTGRLVGEPLHGPAKAAAVAALAAGQGPGPVAGARPTPTRPTTSRCSSLVGHPCAVNPDAALLEHARGARLAGRGLPAGGVAPPSSACSAAAATALPARSPRRPAAVAADAPPVRRAPPLGDRTHRTARVRARGARVREPMRPLG